MIAAGITAVGLVDYGRKAWMGVKAVRQTSNMVNKYRRAPEEMRFTFQLCACLLEALPVAEALATRYRSLAIVGTAVQMARNAVQQATSLFADDSVEDTDDGWAEFMKAGRKYESVQQLQSRLALAISSLQLALAAIQASGLNSAIASPVAESPSSRGVCGFAASPFAYIPEAFDTAQSTFQQMEMGRTRSILLCGGDLWQRGVVGKATGGKSRGKAASTAVDAMRLLFTTRVHLHRGSRKRDSTGAPLDVDNDDSNDDDLDADEDEDGGELAAIATPDKDGSSDSLALWFVGNGRGTEEEGEASSDGMEENERVLILDETVRFRRLWSHELAGEMGEKEGGSFLGLVGGAHVLCYEFTPSSHYAPNKPPTRAAATTPLVLTFQMEVSASGSGGRLSAESFEALLYLALSTLRPAAPTPSAGRSRTSLATPQRVPLASAYDPDDPARFLSEMSKHVGPFVGLPGAKGSAAGKEPKGRGGGAGDESEILTPKMRTLGLS